MVIGILPMVNFYPNSRYVAEEGAAQTGSGDVAGLPDPWPQHQTRGVPAGHHEDLPGGLAAQQQAAGESS